MGLIKALTGTLGDTWKEAIHCPVIGNDTVVVNGEKMHNGNARSSNTKGTDNVISNGSAIMVEEQDIAKHEKEKLENKINEQKQMINEQTEDINFRKAFISKPLINTLYKLYCKKNHRDVK